MSVGGKVIETIVVGDKIWINTFDKHSECAVYVKNNYQEKQISNGDYFWWQGRTCYWTPYVNEEAVEPIERPIQRISSSGVERPKDIACLTHMMLTKNKIKNKIKNQG